MSNPSALPPQELHAALALVRKRYSKMSPAYRQLVDYILDHPYQTAFTSASHLGSTVGLSSATVVRFAGSLGLSGYANLQRLAREGMRRQVDTVTQMKRASRLARGESILDEVLRADITNLERTRELVPEQIFGRAVEMMVKARTIHIAGLRSTYSAAHLLGFNLRMIGRRINLLGPGVGDLPEQLMAMEKGDLCIVISFRRYTKQALDILRAARKARIETISITDSDRSPLGEIAHVSLPVSVQFPAFFESRVAAISLANALVMSVAIETRRATLESLRRHEKSWVEHGTYLIESFDDKYRSRLKAFASMSS